MAGVSLRSLLAKICEEWFLSNSLSTPCVLLSTCNRTELYFSSDDLAATHSIFLRKLKEILSFDFDQKLYTYFDRECFSHLCRVAAGLDSAIIAETEIQAQVREAYERALEQYELPHHLHYLFQKSLKVSKEVRQHLPQRRGIPTLEEAMLKIGGQFFEGENSPKILFVGASAINEKIISTFRKHVFTDLSIINRTPTTVEGIDTLPWKALTSWQSFDWIIVGTKAQEYILTAKGSEYPSKRILIHDLSVPSNVDPKLNLHPNITLMNIDEINKTLEIQQKQIHHLLAKAESFVAASSHRQIELFHAREKARLRAKNNLRKAL